MSGAGRFIHPVELIAYATTKDPVSNEAVKTPAVVGSAWAEVRTLAGKYGETARQRVEGAEVEFVIPFDPMLEVLPAMAVRYSGKDWPIGAAVNVDGKGVEVKITCKRAKA